MRASFPAARCVECNGITLSVHESGAGPAVVLCHGFPELAYSWRHQFPALREAGFRAIAPDLRGYGASSKPAGVRNYDVLTLCSDLVGLLDALEIERAFFVGHDWGALLLWQFALIHPQRMLGYVAVNIPFYARPATDPVARMREVLGESFYIVNFQDSEEADCEFERNTERFFRLLMRRLPISREAYERIPDAKRRAYSMLHALRAGIERGEPLLSDSDLQVFVDAFAAGGFTAPINWYRNWSRNWELTAGVEQRVRVPVLFIGAVDDVLIAPAHIESMRRHVDRLDVEMIPDCGHWTQQERPETFNRILIDWLSREAGD